MAGIVLESRVHVDIHMSQIGFLELFNTLHHKRHIIDVFGRFWMLMSMGVVRTLNSHIVY